MRALLLLLCACTLLFAEFPHFGTIVDASGSPLAGAKVTSKHTGESVTTDSVGQFGSWPESILHSTVTTLDVPQFTMGAIHFSSDNVGSSVQASIHDMMGRQLWHWSGTSQKGINRLNVDGLADGIYLMRLSIDGKVTTQKVNSVNRSKLQITESIVGGAVRQSGRFLPVDDTITISRMNYIRATRTVFAGTIEEVKVALMATTELPVITEKNPVSVKVGEMAIVTVKADDKTGDITGFVWSLDGIDFSTQTALGTHQVQTATVGSFPVYVKALNEYGQESAVDSVIVTVLESNHAPTIDSLAIHTNCIEGSILKVYAKLSDVDGSNPYFSSVVKTELDTVWVDSASDTIFIIPSYDMVKRQTLKEFEIVFSVIDEEYPAVTVPCTLKVTVENKNRSPKVTFPSNTTVGIGNDFRFAPLISDPDGDSFGVTFEATGTEETPFTMIYTGDTIKWHANREIYDAVGEMFTVNMKVMDDFDTVQNSWKITLGNHVWAPVLALDSIVSFSATSSDSIYVLNPQSIMTLYNRRGKAQAASSITLSDLGSFEPLPSQKQFGNVIYSKFRITEVGAMTNGWARILVDGAAYTVDTSLHQSRGDILVSEVRDSQKQYVFTSTMGAYTLYDPDMDAPLTDNAQQDQNFLDECQDLEAAYVGERLFFCRKNGGVYRKNATDSLWREFASEKYVDVEIGSDNGDYVFLAGGYDNKLHRYNNLTGSACTYSPTGIQKVTALNENSVWVLDENNEIYFSGNAFMTSTPIKNKPSDGEIREIIAADDRSTIFVLIHKDGQDILYRY